jgi:NADH:ubiquinone oxidoreductase subunit E
MVDRSVGAAAAASPGAGSGRLLPLHYDLWRFRGEPGELIRLLQVAQESESYVSLPAIQAISGITRVPESEIYGVVTFYRQFRLQPVGRNLIRLCDGTACHVSDARRLKCVIEDELELESGDTTKDGLFTLETVACLGCCSLAPAMMINDQTYGRLTPQSIRRILGHVRRDSTRAAAAAPEVQPS